MRTGSRGWRSRHASQVRLRNRRNLQRIPVYGHHPPDVSDKRIIAPKMARCSSRFCVFEPPPGLLAGSVTSEFAGDWFRRVGKPKRVVADFSAPGIHCLDRNKLPHVYGVQFLATPRRDPRQNGRLGRSFRSPRKAIRATATDPNAEPVGKSARASRDRAHPRTPFYYRNST